MTIETRKTSEYPTRYAAFAEPGVIFEHDAPEHRGGHEWAVYSGPRAYAEIVSYQGKDFMLDVSHRAPSSVHHGGVNEKRVICERFATYQQAFSVMHEALKERDR